MTAINFPDTPTNGQTFAVGLITWVWNGTVWKGTSSPVAGPPGATGATGATGADSTVPGPTGPAGEANFSSFLLMGA